MSTVQSQTSCKDGAAIRLGLLPAAALPAANAVVDASGVLRARPEVVKAVSRRKRHQVVGAIFSEAVAGFDPTSTPWTTVRAVPRTHRNSNQVQRVFDFEVESSLHPGTFSSVHVEYLVNDAKACRTAARKLTQTNRAVRVDDEGLGWMVGAGHHLSYAGLIENFKAAKTMGACLPLACACTVHLLSLRVCVVREQARQARQQGQRAELDGFVAR